MTASRRFAAVDLGASSGRVMVGEVWPDTLRMQTATRFPNHPVATEDGLHWDTEALIEHALDGLAAANAEGGGLVSIGVDAWGVDYGLFRGGRLVGEPFHYRDERRNRMGVPVVEAKVPFSKLYGRIGLQHLTFTTVYQLAADSSAWLADRLLLIPDLVTFALTGVGIAERTAASTTGLLDVRTREWDTALMELLDIKADLFAPLVDPGHRVGGLLPHVSDRVGGRIPVVAVGSHDTASAVVGVPMQSDDAAYVSLGTWALAGLELDRPVLTEEARLANFTNEGGVDGTTRFLTNVMGTWLLSETLRSWGESDLTGLVAQASLITERVSVVDVQDVRFLPPSGEHGDMPGRIAAWCAEHDVPAPQGKPATVRCILESIAAAIARALGQASRLADRPIDVVHVVGGGAQNSLLCQAIANRSGLPVLAGPVEATAIGNVLVQARSAGLVGTELADLRALVAASHQLAQYVPQT